MIASAAVAVGGTAYGIASDISKQKEGRKMQREAQQRIDSFKWQDLTNPYKTLQVSTLGADLRREEAQLTESGVIDTLQQSGTRGVLGGTGALQTNQNKLNRDIAVNLDEQQKDIDKMAAQEDARIRDIQEQRQQAELAGYGQMLSTGMNMNYAGQAGVTNGLLAASQLISANKDLFKSGNTPDTSKMGGNFGQFDFTKYGMDPTGGTAYGLGGKVNELVGTIQNSPNYEKVYGSGGFGLGSMGTGFGLKM